MGQVDRGFTIGVFAPRTSLASGDQLGVVTPPTAGNPV